MRKSVLAAVAVVLAFATLASAVVAAAVLDDTEVRDGERFYISYRTDGGTLPADAPGYYVAGSSATLPVPEREGYWFAGWCTETALTNPIMGIPADLRGHIILYAKWVEDTRVGTGWTMEVSGEYRNGDIPHTVEGTVTWGYDTVRDGMALVSQDRDVSYSWPDGGWNDGSSQSNWCRGVTDGWTYAGNEFMGDERVTVWTRGGDTMWVKDLLIPMRIESRMGTEGTVVYETTEVFGYDPDTSFAPNVYADHPLTVGVMEADAERPLFLYAYGDGFEGWYVNGSLATTDRTLTVLMPSPSDVYRACASGGYVTVEGFQDVVDMGFGDAEISDASGEPVARPVSPGLYTAVKEIDGVTTTLEFLIEDERTFSLTWVYDGIRYRYSDTVLLSQAYAYEYAHPTLPRFAQHYQSHMETFYTPDDPVIIRMAEALMELGSGLDRLRYAEFVLEFVQSVPYLEDIDTRGSHEYWKFPVETLWDGGGDCEDTTFLFGTIMGLSGYRTAFLLFDDHAMPAVELDAPGYGIGILGYRFVLCETSGDSFKIGDTSEGHHPEDTIFACRIESVRWSIIDDWHNGAHERQTFRVHGPCERDRPAGAPHHQLRHGQRLRQRVHLRRGIAGHDRCRRGRPRDGRHLVGHGPEHRHPEREDRRLHAHRRRMRPYEGSPDDPGPRWSGSHRIPHQDRPHAHGTGAGRHQGERRGDRRALRTRREGRGRGLPRIVG